jgi:4-amino-4-deoxy-L-arabinose transferase-like glycosyltransferase
VETWSRWLAFILITFLAAGLFSLRLAAPPNLLDQDQQRPAAYVLDVVKNGQWLCQRDISDDITSKPPFYTWLCALATLAYGRINVFTLYLPGALAAWGVACLIFAVGRQYFGTRAGFFGALASLLTSAGLKEFGLARSDGVFAFTVTAAALLAFRAWIQGKGWAWFWVMAALATLTKGPLGLLLAGGGLLGCLWERRSGDPLPLRGSHLAGLGLYLLIAGGWFLWAYSQFGQPLVAKMLSKELVNHAVGGNHLPGRFFYQPALYYLGRGAPWSLLGYYALWRLWKSPATEASARRLERFLCCWFLAGLVLFSLAPHQRADHLWPIMPATALLAGRELARLTRRVPDTILLPATTLFVALLVGGFAFYYFGPRARPLVVQQSMALKALAAEIERRAGREFPLTHVDDDMALQVYLNTRRPPVSRERAAKLLNGPEAAFIAVNDLAAFQTARGSNAPPIYTLLSEAVGSSKSPAHILSNCPDLQKQDGFDFCFGPLLIKAHGVRLLDATELGFHFEIEENTGDISVSNDSAETRKVHIRAGRRAHQANYERLLAGNEIWKLTLKSSQP